MRGESRRLFRSEKSRLHVFQHRLKNYDFGMADELDDSSALSYYSSLFYYNPKNISRLQKLHAKECLRKSV